MAQTITPVVHGGRRGRWLGSVILHTAGATASAAVFGAALGGIGRVLGAPWGAAGLAAVAAVAAAYATRELLRIPIPLPNLRRQVPDWWRTFFSPPAAAALYGLGLGVGFFTYLTFGTLVAVAGAAIASGRIAAGALVVAPFGLARGLSLLVAANATDAARLRRMADRLDEFGASLVPRIVNGIALLALAGAAIAAGVSVHAASDWSGLAAATVAAAFAWAGFAKILRPSAWRRALGSYRLGALRPFTASIVPALELAVPVLIAAGRIAAGSQLALAMLGAFSLAVFRARRLSGDRLACGCFGRSRVRDYRAILARNAALAAVAVAAVAGRHPESTAALHRPAGAEILPAALAALGLVLTAAVGLAIARTLSPTDLGSSR